MKYRWGSKLHEKQVHPSGSQNDDVSEGIRIRARKHKVRSISTPKSRVHNSRNSVLPEKDSRGRK